MTVSASKSTRWNLAHDVWLHTRVDHNVNVSQVERFASSLNDYFVALTITDRASRRSGPSTGRVQLSSRRYGGLAVARPTVWRQFGMMVVPIAVTHLMKD